MFIKRSTLALWMLCLPLLAAGDGLLSDGPYKDVTRGIGSPEPLISTAPWHDKRSTLIWAFATGECGDERWGDFDTDTFARANVAQAQRSGQRYVLSTGGALGIFTCASDDGMARFVARYDSALLVGLDFDIEGAQTPAQVTQLVQRRGGRVLTTHQRGSASP